MTDVQPPTSRGLIAHGGHVELGGFPGQLTGGATLCCS